ncbi:MAG: NAD(P)H-hydrate dehydratase [Bacteroidetes bacterium]|nr:NAD(P)H-hydrate dehydratase [Bacteroidota bacterium]MCH8523409.1 NAD(P)H-hydrate dehydratase [Balneolales bacterium]
MKFQALHTRESSRYLDEQTITSGVPGTALMESAGAGAASHILRLYPDLQRAFVFTGKGSNGGDGWVVARYLASQGVEVHICCIHPISEKTNTTEGISDNATKTIPAGEGTAPENIIPDNLLAKDAAVHARAVVNMINNGSHPITVESVHTMQPPKTTTNAVVVDALLGTGLSSEVRSDTASAIEFIHALQLPIISMDVPSGLDATTGQVHGIAIKATHTVCFGSLKTGLYVNKGPEHRGETHLVQLGFLNKGKPGNPFRYLLEETSAGESPLLKRKHKYDSGVVYVAGGSPGMIGAAVMAGKAAWKTGCGAVFLLVPAKFMQLAEQLAPELIILSREESGASYLNADDARYLSDKLAQRPGTVLAGPGLGRNDRTKAFILEFFENHAETSVIDADALHFITDLPLKAEHILTPHPGELRSLLNTDISDSWNRMHAAEIFAQHSGNTIVSKGYPTVVCTPQSETWITGYDTRIFNRAGFGDVLSGATAGWLSQTKNISYSCLKSLTDGKLAINRARREGIAHPEPSDII